MRRGFWIRRVSLILFFQAALAAVASAQSAPRDLWTPDVLHKIRDRHSLNIRLIPRAGYAEVFFDSEIGDAKWADSDPPYAVHVGDTIRMKTKVLEKEERSRGKRGVVTWQRRIVNQHDKVVEEGVIQTLVEGRARRAMES